MRRARVPGTRRTWVIEGLVPAGSIVTASDLDDPEPEAYFEQGFDVVLKLHDRGPLGDEPVLLEPRWRPGLLGDQPPPPPFWIQEINGRIVRVEEGAAA
jgi:hypothetical protein